MDVFIYYKILHSLLNEHYMYNTKIFMLSHLFTIFRGGNPLLQAFDSNDIIESIYIFVINRSVNTEQTICMLLPSDNNTFTSHNKQSIFII